jgi:hypothetical protein
MAGQGSGRRKSGSTEPSRTNNGNEEDTTRIAQSESVKKKGKNQVVYNGPPSYLLDPNRSDLFADPRNVVQDKDGTNHLIGSGLSPTLQGHGPFQPSTTFQHSNQSRTQTLHLSAERKPGSGLAEVEPYDYAILPIEKPSEHEARIGASKLGRAFPVKQNKSGSNFPSEAEIYAPPANNIVGSQPSQNYPSEQYESRFSLKPGFVLDLQQSNTLARRQNTSTSIAEHQSEQPNHNIVTLQTTTSSLPHRYAETTVQQLHPSQQSQAYPSRQYNPTNSSLFSRFRQTLGPRSQRCSSTLSDNTASKIWLNQEYTTE